jgi:hypothetical protein
MKERSRRGVLELVDKYLACHGISTNGLTDLGQLVMMISNSAARNVLAGAATGAALASGENSPAARLLCGAIADKMRIFGMAAPTAVAEEVEAQENEQGKIVVAANGHNV